MKIQFLLILLLIGIIVLVPTTSVYADSATVWINKAVDLTKNKDYNGALKAFDKALEIDPNNIKALSGKAAVLNLLDAYDDFIKEIDRNLKENPNNIQGWIAKGDALILMGRYKEATMAFDKALEIDPKNVEAKKLQSEAFRVEALKLLNK
jgi:cytochrome c-type biogenesis protein CcmH/NrfG